MKMSNELAEKVLEAFGPCTTLYECTTAEELIEQAKDFDTLKECIDVMLTCEEIHAERDMDVAYHEESSGEEAYKNKHQKVIDESKERIAAIRQRCDRLLEE